MHAMPLDAPNVNVNCARLYSEKRRAALKNRTIRQWGGLISWNPTLVKGKIRTSFPVGNSERARKKQAISSFC